MPKLNAEQQLAVHTIDKPLLVLAGAGSGKTRVITEKIAYLVKQGLAARHIAALTFTNKAAREMKERVGKLLDNKQLRGLRVSTFHSLGLDIIRKEYAILGYKAAITLFDEQDKITLLKNLITHNDLNYELDLVDSYARQIGQWKNAFITPEQALISTEAEQEVALLYQNYQQSLKAYNATDFDDLILLPVLLFQQYPDTLIQWQQKIRYLLVDEYQDTNITQYHLVKLLVGKLGKFTVVGDDDQSIYAWRGAQPENLAQLQTDYPQLKLIKLEQNYRSFGRILKVANHLIAQNTHAFEKKLWSDLEFGEKLRVLSHKNDTQEAKQIIAEIVHHRLKTASSFNDYAILYRGNHQSRLFESSLREQNVPYIISGSTSFFAYAEIKDILAYLRLFVNQDDDAAFLRVVNTPRREIGPTTLAKLGGYANQRHISLFKACTEMGLQEQLSNASIKRLQTFCRWVHKTALSMQSGDTFAIIDEFIQDINYTQWLQENSKSPQAAERKLKNVHDLIEWLQRIANKDENEEKTLDEIVAKIQLMDILERNQDEQADDQVSLMTLHAAKGLEFPHVFLIGIEENILPHQNSIDSDNIEEERRLAYVGITRAQQSCTFSYCTHRKRYGDINESDPSRFLSELPEEDLEWTSKHPVDKSEQQSRSRDNIAHLKALFT